MLSSVLRSKRAIQVNVEIMRAFVRLRRMLASNEELARKLGLLKRNTTHSSRSFSMRFENSWRHRHLSGDGLVLS